METSVLLIGDKTKLKEYADFKKVTAWFVNKFDL